MMTMSSMFQVGVPSLDRPFGIHLWPFFESAYTFVVGSRPQDFRFVPGQIPMSSLTAVLATLVAYYVIILGGREVMRQREAKQLNNLFILHNLGLTIVSGVLLLLLIEQILPTIVRKGIFSAVCHLDAGWTDKLVVLYYLNYLTKYLELIDTVFLFLKKKPLTFLHTYHHGATAFLVYTQLVGPTPVTWIPSILNLWVHVVMYWYYFQAARGVRIWWKKYITIMQITQFVVDLIFIYFCAYNYQATTKFTWLPAYGACAATDLSSFTGVTIISSYLFLFLGFYTATYKKPAKTFARGHRRVTSALISLQDEKLPTVNEVHRRFSHAEMALTDAIEQAVANVSKTTENKGYDRMM